jgi:hypothetical protein
MPLEDRLDHILNLIEAGAQRQDSLRDLVSRIRTRNLWRSADGLIQIDATPEQKTQMVASIEAYLCDLENITAGIRLALGGKPTG